MQQTKLDDHVKSAPVVEVAVAQAAQEVGNALKAGKHDAPGNDLASQRLLQRCQAVRCACFHWQEVLVMTRQIIKTTLLALGCVKSVSEETYQ